MVFCYFKIIRNATSLSVFTVKIVTFYKGNFSERELGLSFWWFSTTR